MELNEVSGIVVDSAIKLYGGLGPGLLESVYQTLLTKDLVRRGLRVEMQKPVSFEYDGIKFDGGLRIDLLVESKLVVELKSVEAFLPIHYKQILTYLRLLDLPLGILVNFGAPTSKEVIKRVINGFNYPDIITPPKPIRARR